MIGIVFASGASIDLLPDSFFRDIENMDHMAFGVNRSVISKRLLDADFLLDGIVGWDSFKPEDALDRARKAEYLKHADWPSTEFIYLNESWGIPGSITPAITPLHNSAELAAKLLVKNHGCTEIWLIGCEGIGPHCRTFPYFDPYQTNCDMTFAQGGFFQMNGKPAAWKQTVDELKVPFKVFPHWSLLHPYIVPNAIRIIDNCDEVIFE